MNTLGLEGIVHKAEVQPSLIMNSCPNVDWQLVNNCKPADYCVAFLILLPSTCFVFEWLVFCLSLN